MTKIKICGVTNLEDALLSVRLGADALGFNFYPNSPRYILPENARVIVEQLPVNFLTVGVFVNADRDLIDAVVGTVRLGAVQLHGAETPEFVRKLKADLNLPVIKAFGVSSAFKPEDVLQFDADAILLDAYSTKEHGGTGETFDWEIARKVQEIFPNMYLAGGLSDENIVRAIETVRPFGVDACSKLEIKKGVKDRAKLKTFFDRIGQACRTA